MAIARPFEDAAGGCCAPPSGTWWALADDDRLHAFAAHPQIGGNAAAHTAEATAWSSDEQRATAAADAQVLANLAAANREYVDRFGFIYIVCASGRSMRRA